MIWAQNTKSGILVKPVSVATNATQTGRVDTSGWDYLTIIWSLDSAGDTTNNPAVLKLAESDDTTTTRTDITAFVGDGAGGFTVPDASTDTPQIVRMDLDLRGRKKYITGFITAAGAAQLAGATYHLTRGDLAPTSASEAGCAAWVVG